MIPVGTLCLVTGGLRQSLIGRVCTVDAVGSCGRLHLHPITFEDTHCVGHVRFPSGREQVVGLLSWSCLTPIAPPPIDVNTSTPRDLEAV